MSFKGKLNIAGKEYNLLSSSYGLFQETDATGRPSSVTRGGMISFEVESTGDTGLSDWMFNNFETRNGSLIFLKRDTDAKAKELEFTDAYCVKYSEVFDSTGKNPMVEKVTISAREIKMGNADFENEWPV